MKDPAAVLKNLDTAERSELVEAYNYCRYMSDEWLKRQIVEKNRIDILAIHVLGYKVQPFHLAMLRFQFLHPDNLQLVFRGAGKTTLCAITKTIHLLLKNPNLRILVTSKTSRHAETILKEIKSQLEDNIKLTEVFGPYYDSKLVKKWDNTEIEVLPRTSRAKEGSVTTLGVGSQVVGKHYDIIISDDLVDEENSRTKHMRDKQKTWYYQSLDPTLEPPDDEVPHRGEHHRLGTRYHYDDLYGHFIENELKDHHQVIPALSADGRTPWPEKFTASYFFEKKKKAGIIIFNAQYQCDTEAMKGEIFQYDQCQLIEEGNIPSGLRIFMGVDLAITEQESADQFAIVVLGLDKSGNRYILDYYANQIRFGAQTKKIIEFYEKYKPIKCCIETNAYQKAQFQHLKDEYDVDIRLKPVNQDKDKITRAWKLSSLFEGMKMFFKKGGNMHLLIEQLVLFPNYKYKDLFDALDLATRASKLIKKRRRTLEPGLL